MNVIIGVYPLWGAVEKVYFHPAKAARMLS